MNEGKYVCRPMYVCRYDNCAYVVCVSNVFYFTCILSLTVSLYTHTHTHMHIHRNSITRSNTHTYTTACTYVESNNDNKNENIRFQRHLFLLLNSSLKQHAAMTIEHDITNLSHIVSQRHDIDEFLFDSLVVQNSIQFLHDLAMMVTTISPRANLQRRRR